MHTMMTKSIKEIKADAGVYFELASIFDEKYENNNLFLMAHRLNFQSFKESLNFWYDFATGQNKKSVFVKENFYAERLHWIFSNTEMSTSLEEIKNIALENALYEFKNFVSLCRDKMTVKMSAKNKRVKQVFSLSLTFKKMDYLISQEEVVCHKKAEDLFKISLDQQYFSEEQMVCLPANWDDLIKNEKVAAYQVNENGMKHLEGVVNSMFFDKHSNSMDIRIEMAGSDGYNIPFYHMEKGVYQFSNPTMFFSKEEALAQAKSVSEKMRLKMIEIEETIAC